MFPLLVFMSQKKRYCRAMLCNSSYIICFTQEFTRRSCIIFSMMSIRRTGSCSPRFGILFLFSSFSKNSDVLGYSLGESKRMVGTCVMLCRRPKHMFFVILTYLD